MAVHHDPRARAGPRPTAVVTLLVLASASIASASDAPGPGDGPVPTGPVPTAVATAFDDGYVLPLDAAVLDWFRPPRQPYGPGNRGWELATAGGEPVGSVGGGTVAFAGRVAGRGVVSVEHPDGLRSSLTGLARIDVAAGDTVAAGTPLGTAAPGLHLGFRYQGRYVDPSVVYRVRVHARLVPAPPTPP